MFQAALRESIMSTSVRANLRTRPFLGAGQQGSNDEKGAGVSPEEKRNPHDADDAARPGQHDRHHKGSVNLLEKS